MKSIYCIQNIDVSQNMGGIVMDRYCLVPCSVLWIFNGKEPFLYHSRNREPFSVMTVVKNIIIGVMEDCEIARKSLSKKV
jgi:hypothetical protein